MTWRRDTWSGEDTNPLALHMVLGIVKRIPMYEGTKQHSSCPRLFLPESISRMPDSKDLVSCPVSVPAGFASRKTDDVCMYVHSLAYSLMD